MRVTTWEGDRVITGPQLAAARARAGLTQRELAQLLRHGDRIIQKWEKDGVARGKEALVKQVLGDFLGDEGAPPPLSSYSNWALLTELGRRLEESEKNQTVRPAGDESQPTATVEDSGHRGAGRFASKGDVRAVDEDDPEV